jgi:hypothetical protein
LNKIRDHTVARNVKDDLDQTGWEICPRLATRAEQRMSRGVRYRAALADFRDRICR